AGSLWFKDSVVTLEAKEGSGVLVNDSAKTKAVLKSDADTAGPTVIKIGSVMFFVIKRANQIGVRVKDSQHPNRLNFAGLKFFPVDLKWRIHSKFEPYPEPKKMSIP